MAESQMVGRSQFYSPLHSMAWGAFSTSATANPSAKSSYSSFGYPPTPPKVWIIWKSLKGQSNEIFYLSTCHQEKNLRTGILARRCLMPCGEIDSPGYQTLGIFLKVRITWQNLNKIDIQLISDPGGLYWWKQLEDENLIGLPLSGWKVCRLPSWKLIRTNIIALCWTLVHMYCRTRCPPPQPR